MIAYVQNNQVITVPGPAPKVWKNPITGENISCFYNLAWEKMYALGWREVVDTPPSYDADYEKITVSDWYYDENNDVVTRDYTVEYLSFTEALTNAFNKLDYNRYLYETGGFTYDYYGIEVKIFTDRESSQPKLIAAKVTAEAGERNDTDVWKFQKIEDGSSLVVQLSNADLLSICEMVFRNIQDSYNMQSAIAWQLLGCETTEGIKTAIESGAINLNPWGV